MTVPGSAAGPLSGAVAQLATALLPQVSPRTAAGIRQVLARLDGPLQVAVAGRIKAGKSTLVNALIGRRIAPTDVGECTRLVTRFQYGTVDRLEVVYADGRRVTKPLAPDGGIPADLGVDLAEVSHLEAFLTSGLLSGITVIDTPGLGSLDADSVSRTEQLLGTVGAGRHRAESDAAAAASEAPGGDGGAGVRAGPGGDGPSAGTPDDQLDPVSRMALAGAEAVVYVFTQGVRADDTATLAAFTAATAARDAGPVNVLGVLNKADTIPPESVQGWPPDPAGLPDAVGLPDPAGSPGPAGRAGRAADAADAAGDPFRAAQLVAQAQAAVLRPRVATVLPVVGLVAETMETGAFTAADVEALRALTAVDPAMFGAMMMAADLFTTLDAPVDGEARLRLLELLDLYGIGRAVAMLRTEPTMGAGELRRRLLDGSGLAELRTSIGEVFAARADGIKASAALASLATLAAASPDWAERQRVRDAIEVLLQRPEAHQFRMLEALTLLSSGTVELPADLTDEVLRLGGSSTPEAQLGLPGRPRPELIEAALQRATWWRGHAAFGGTPAQNRIAHVVHRAYFLLWQELRGAVPSPPAGQLAGGPPPARGWRG